MRGQSLLETLIVIAVVLIAVGIGTASFRLLAVNGRANVARLIALDAAQNAATELLAAAVYDPTVTARLGSAQWQVASPAPPSGAPALEASPIVLSVTPQQGSQAANPARDVLIHYTIGSLQGDLPVTLRPLTVPPGSIIDTSPTPAQ